MSTDCTPRYCYADPYEGGKQAIAECYRNLSAVGSTPLAVTNCLNFANPQRPEIMAQIVEALRGMGDACRALDYPIVSGNVSLYNESKATGGGSAILPTPAIGGVGLMEDWSKSATIAFKAEGEQLLLIGGKGRQLGQSLWLREIAGREAGDSPKVDLAAECKHGEFVRALIADGLVTAVHDVSDGGTLVAATEMALAGNIGFVSLIGLSSAEAFGEDQGRYIVTAGNEAAAAIRSRAEAAGIAVEQAGYTSGDAVMFDKGWSIPLTTLRAANEAFFKDWMEG